MIRTSRGEKIIAASPRLASIETRSARLIRDAAREFIRVAMTPTWRIVVVLVANAAAVAGKHRFQRGAVEGEPRPDLLGDPHMLAGNIGIPAEQVLQPDGGGLAALRGQDPVAVDDGDLGDLGPVRPA